VNGGRLCDIPSSTLTENRVCSGGHTCDRTGLSQWTVTRSTDRPLNILVDIPVQVVRESWTFFGSAFEYLANILGRDGGLVGHRRMAERGA
jgi:hypothetical protein